MQEKRVDDVVASICDQGCRYVNAVLEDVNVRCDCQALKTLDAAEQARVLEELAAVMAVYSQSSGCEI